MSKDYIIKKLNKCSRLTKDAGQINHGDEDLEKSRSLPVGTIRERKGGKFVKTHDGWIPYKTTHTESTPEAPKAESVEQKPSPRDIADSKDDTEYVNARESKFSNIGEDVSGSARHKRVQWGGAKDAIASGRGDLITRDKLLKVEPLSVDIQSNTAFNDAAIIMAMRKFPPKPDERYLKMTAGKEDDEPVMFIKNRRLYRAEMLQKFIDAGTEPDKVWTAKELREEVLTSYYETFNDVKTAFEELSKDYQAKKTDYAADPLETLTLIRSAVNDVIDKRREGKVVDFGAEGLINYHNNTLKPRSNSKTSLVAGLAQLAKFVKSNEDPVKALEDAAAALAEGQTLDKITNVYKEKGFDPATRYDNNARRVGPEYHSIDTPEEQINFLVEKSRMRAIQWGNSVTDSERQYHLKQVSLAFKDMTDILGLPDEMGSFNGRLALAIGARGKGRALAHYERDTNTINMTRTNGIGSLAHEYGHFFDKTLGDTHGYSLAFLSKESRWSQKTPIAEAMNNITKSEGWEELIDSSKQAIKDHNEYSSAKYWLSTEEMFARAFECHVSLKLKKAGRENTYLSGVKLGGFWPTEEISEKLAPLFDDLFDKFKNSEHLKKSMSRSFFLIKEKLEKSLKKNSSLPISYSKEANHEPGRKSEAGSGMAGVVQQPVRRGKGQSNGRYRPSFSELNKAYQHKNTWRPDHSDKDGMPHPDSKKPYIKATSASGNPVWRYNDEHSKRSESDFKTNFTKYMTGKVSDNTRNLIYGLGRKLAQDPDLHNVATGNDDGTQSLRLRHFSNALKGSNGYSISESGNGITITAPRHSGNRDNSGETHSWHFDGKDLVFNKDDLGKADVDEGYYPNLTVRKIDRDYDVPYKSYRLKNGMFHHIFAEPGFSDSYTHVLSSSQDPFDAESFLSKLTGNVGSEGDLYVDSSQAHEVGRGHGKMLYERVLGHHGSMISDTQLSPGSHKIYSEHFSSIPGVETDITDDPYKPHTAKLYNKDQYNQYIGDAEELDKAFSKDDLNKGAKKLEQAPSISVDERYLDHNADLVDGLDLNDYDKEWENTGITKGTHVYNHPSGHKVFSKPNMDTKLLADAFDPFSEIIADEYRHHDFDNLGSAHRESAYQRLATNFFGLSNDHVPRTTLFFKDGVLHSGQEFLDDVQPGFLFDPDTSDPVLLHKMALVDAILGNNDRHEGNYLTRGNTPVLIDNGLAFDYHETPIGTHNHSAFLRNANDDISHDHMTEEVGDWLYGLDEDLFSAKLDKLGLPESHKNVAKERLREAKMNYSNYEKLSDTLDYLKTIKYGGE